MFLRLTFLNAAAQRGDSVASSLGTSDNEPTTPDPRSRRSSAKPRVPTADRHLSRDSSVASDDSRDLALSRLKESVPPRV